MMDEHKVHSGYVRRYKTADGGHAELTINVSGIAPTDSDEVVRMMVGRASVALEFMMAEVESRATSALASVAPLPKQPAHAPRVHHAQQPKLNADAFLAPSEPAQAPATVEPPIEPPVKELAQAMAGVVDAKTHTHDPFENGKEYIPSGSEVTIGSSAFGLIINWPPEDWIANPITEVNRDGSGGGQLLALNAGLSSIGCKGGDRHTACVEILTEYGPIHSLPVREHVSSLRDLTEAEASVILEWIARAEQAHIEQLLFSMGGVGGHSSLQEVLI